MRVQAWVTLDGEDVTHRAVVGASTRYGRDRVGEPADPGSCVLELVQLVDDVPVPVSIGQRLELGIVTTGGRLTRFAGTVTDVVVPLYAGTRTRQIIAVSDALGRMARRIIGDEPWPQETAGARAQRIAQLAGVSCDVLGEDRLQVVAQDVDRQQALGLLQQLADTADAVLAEQPGQGAAFQWHTAEYRRLPAGQGAMPQLVPADAMTNEDLWLSAGDGYGYPGGTVAAEPGNLMRIDWNPAPGQSPDGGRMIGLYVTQEAGQRYQLTVTGDGTGDARDVKACAAWLASGAWTPADSLEPFTVTWVAPADGVRLVGVEIAAADGTLETFTVTSMSCQVVADPGRTLELPANVVVAGAEADQRVTTLTNRARVRYGPADAEAQPEVIAQDQPSIDRWGEYEVSVSTQLALEADAVERANRLVALGRAPAWQFAGVTVDLGLRTVDDVLAGQVLALRIGDRVSLADVDSEASPAVHVEGWADQLDGVDSWRVQLNLSASQLTVPAPRWIDVHPETTWASLPPDLTWIGAAVGPLSEG